MRQNYRWHFGNGIRLDFNAPQGPTQDAAGALVTLEGSATICDRQSGALILSTDGVTIWDAQGNALPVQLRGQASATTSAVIVPRPGTTDRFFIFNPGETSGLDHHNALVNGRIDPTRFDIDYSNGPTRGVHCTEVRADQSGAAVIPGQLNVQLPVPSADATVHPTEKLAVVVHANCVDYWVVVGHETTFHVYRVSAQGVRLEHSLPAQMGVRMSPLGYIKFSPDGRRMAVASYDMMDSQWRRPASLALFRFDPQSGLISDPQRPAWETWADRGSPYGLEFSTSGEVLYVSLARQLDDADPDIRVALLQLDLAATPTTIELAADIITTAPLASFPDRPRRGVPHARVGVGALLRSPVPGDGRIFVAMPATRALGVITQPEVRVTPNGNECGFDQQGLPLDDLAFWGLPTLVEYGQCADDDCKSMIAAVNTTLSAACAQMANTMAPCDAPSADCGCTTDPSACAPIVLPEVAPCITVRWGTTPAEAMGQTGVETACVTVCNCTTNLTFKHLSIATIQVVDLNGNPAPPEVTVTPIGPYSFGDIAPCSCVSRQFVVQTNGAAPGQYRLLLRGICFDVCWHYNLDDCVTFTVD